MKRYKKKPETYEALIWTGDNFDDIKAWLKTPAVGLIKVANRHVVIPTHRGNLIARPDDYIIRKPSGELTTMRPAMFQATYEAIND